MSNVALARVMAAAPGGKVIVYEAPDGEVRVNVRLERETVWLTRAQMAELFGRERPVVTKDVQTAFREGEPAPAATIAKFALVRTEEGRTVTRDVVHFSLEVIISVSYLNKSLRAPSSVAVASQVISATIDAGLIKADESVGGSRKFARYLPFLA